MAGTPFPLGRHPEAAANHDPRSRSFSAPAAITVVDKKWRRYGAVLDQGQVGSCTGNAGIGCLNHAPLHVVGTPCGTEADALKLYEDVTQADPYPGAYPPDDTGSDGLSVAKVLLGRGTISAYSHAFGLDHVLSAAMAGALICGTDWYDGMFHPDSKGVIQPTGSVAGGHEYVLDGVYATARMLRFQNSWGSSWGWYGKFFMSFDDFSKLLSAGGDAILFHR